jgi:hypothetical protein
MNIIYKLFKVSARALLLISSIFSLILYLGFLLFQFSTHYTIENSPNGYFRAIDQAGSFWLVMSVSTTLCLSLFILQGFLLNKYVFNIRKTHAYLMIGSILLLNIYASIPNIHISSLVDKKSLINLADERFPYYFNNNYYFTKSANVYYITRSELKVPHNNTRLMQLLLNKVNYYNYKIDGKPNKNISEKFLNFQAENGLVADGVLGPKTKNRFFKKLYISELNKIKKDEDLKKSVLQLNSNDSIWGLGIITIPYYITPIYSYGLMFKEEVGLLLEDDDLLDNLSIIDSIFYKLVLKNHNIDIVSEGNWSENGQIVSSGYNKHGKHFTTRIKNLDVLSDEFLDTLLKLSTRTDSIRIRLDIKPVIK